MYTESAWVYSMSLVGTIVSCIGVPLFWMVSGALLLPKKESWKSVYKKRIPRIAGALVTFSVIRYFYICMTGNQNTYVGDFFRRFYTQEIFLPYWFLYEYLGILLVLPFLRKLMQNLTQQEEKALFILILGWNVLNDISKIYLNVGFMINLHLQNSISYFIFGYLMENCRMFRRSHRKGLWLAVGQAAIVVGGMYLYFCRQQGREVPDSLIMLLTISVYYIIRYIGEKSIWNKAAMYRLVLWCGNNVFGIYLIEDYLRNGTVVIWESLGPYISAIPACAIWLLAVFLIGNVLVSAAHRLPLLGKIL